MRNMKSDFSVGPFMFLMYLLSKTVYLFPA